jgi:hypothetical protein
VSTTLLPQFESFPPRSARRLSRLKSKQQRLEREQQRMLRRHQSSAIVPIQAESIPIDQDKHFTPAQLAEITGRSIWTIRRMVANLPGVIRYGTGRRQYMSIPARVWNAQYRRLQEV